VQLTNVFFGTNSGATITNGFVTVTNISGQKFNLWFSINDLSDIGQTFPAFAYSVSGVMFGSMNPSVPVNGTPNPNFAVAVTKFSDINTNVGVTPSSAAICAGGAVTLTATQSDPGPVTYLWSPGGATTASITASPGSTTTYTVTVTDTGTSTVWGSALATVTVNPLPVTQSIRATSASICSNSPTTISLASSVTGSTYLLQTNANVGVGTIYASTNGTGSAVTFAAVTPKVSTTYWVLATNSSGCSLTIGSTNITVNALPVTQALSATSASICSNSPTTISIASSVAGTTYLLQTNATIGLGTVFASASGSGSALAFAAVTPKVSTTYWVVATNASGCGLTIGSTNITVNPLPATSVITGPSTVNAGQSGVTYSVTATGGSTYGWTVPAGASFTGGSANSISVTFGSTSGSVSVTETNASGCTGTPVSKSVTVVASLLPVTITSIAGTSINYTGGSGSQFVLLSSGNLTNLPSSWLRLLTNTTTPGLFTIPPVGSSNVLFYRVKSE
jgi:hypothetical protein